MHSVSGTSLLEVISLEGSSYELGFQHGAAHAERIKGFLEDRLARINAILYAPKTIAELRPEIEEYLSLIELHCPALYMEIRGLADGAGISLHESALLQLRRELVGYRQVRAGGDCTTFARATPRGHVLGQTIDLNGDMARELSVLRIRHRMSGRRVLLVSFTGLLGYLGINDRGLAVGLNLVLGGQWGKGLPAYLVIRKLLDEASSAHECLKLLGAFPLASSRSLTICGPDCIMNVEYIRDEIRSVEEAQVVHTNHFLRPQFATRDELNPFALNSSRARLEACTEALRHLSASSDDAAYFDILGRAPVFVPSNGSVRQECTVASVVARPAEGYLELRSARGQSLRVSI